VIDHEARMRAKDVAAPRPPAGAVAAPATTSRKTTKESREKSRRRFQTYNAFADKVARFVPAAARDVWFVLYRFADADTDQAEVRVPDIADRLGCDDRTAERGLKWLMANGLLTRLRRGTRQTGPSLYLLDPDPARHVDELRRKHEQRAATKRQPDTRPGTPTVRSENGRFSTRHG
jgi:hypothetical protein